MTPSASRGKSFVLIIAMLAVGLSLANIVFYNYAIGSEKIASQSLRLALTVILMMFVYYGEPWARLVTGILMMVSGVLALVAGFDAISFTYYAIIPIMMGIFYLPSGLLLMFSGDVRSFMEYQRQSE